MRKTHLLGLLFLGGVLLLTGCTPGPNTTVNVPASDGNIAGFWLGL
ncbi:MAG: lipoprotein [bacterium]|nr:lipoprotein [bacterium]